MVKRLLVIALLTGCGKKTEPTPAPPAPEGPATGSAAGSAAPQPAVPANAAPPVASDAAIDAAPAGAAATVDAIAAGSGAPPDYEATLCPKVLPKIVECQKDPAFLEALNAGATAKEKKVTAKLLREVAEWPETMSCSDLAPAYEYGGFIYHWDKFAAFPDALESCGKLGAAIKAAGGLFGGEQGH